MVAQGASNKEVAEELYVTVHTVRKHLENTYRKLGVTNRTAAALRLRAGS
jgi:DNA-binding NarL/FixJ family response regulator